MAIRSVAGKAAAPTANTTRSSSKHAASRARRILDGSGIPLHADNQTVVKERIALDEKNADVLRNEITLMDNAFTQPWTVTRSTSAIAIQSGANTAAAKTTNTFHPERSLFLSATAI